MAVNDKLILICGESSSGKSASLKDLKDPKNVMYLNTESNKRLPFRNKDKFWEVNITDPYEVVAGMEAAEDAENADVHTIVLDSVTFMLDQFESIYIDGSSNGMQAWSDFSQFFKKLMQKTVAESTKNIIVTAHTLKTLRDEKVMEVKIPVKGALKNNGLEAYFSLIVATKKISIKDLEKGEYESDFLNITDLERKIGYKHCFQTQITAETIHERIRSPMGMFTEKETFIDNNAQFLLDRLNEYYD